MKLPIIRDLEKITNFLKTSLGPKSKDKILIDDKGNIKITNDGATILKSIKYDSIASIILRDACSVQDNEIGDGTTSICCLINELVFEAQHLLKIGIHLQTILKGYKLSANLALKIIKQNCFSYSNNLKAFLADLLDITRTSLNSKIIFSNREHFSRIAVKAVLNLKGSTDIDRIQILGEVGGTLRDSFLEEGFIIEKKISSGHFKRIIGAKILIANTSLDSDKIKIHGTKIKVKNLSKLAKIEVREQKKILDKCKKIISHGVNVLINRQLIYNFPERFLNENGVLTIEHADFEGIERLALVTGAEIVSTFDEPEKVKLGRCEIIEEVMIGEKTMIRFSGCHGKGASTIVLRGSNLQIISEAERSIHDALSVIIQAIKNPDFVYGGGVVDSKIIIGLEKFMKNVDHKEALVIRAFSAAIKNLLKIIIENSGLDPAEILESLLKQHENPQSDSCFDVYSEKICSAKKIGLIECSRLKIQTILSAVETAEMIMRIDKMFLND
jgi:T-complex protein 1 subunit beta